MYVYANLCFDEAVTNNNERLSGDTARLGVKLHYYFLLGTSSHQRLPF